MTNALRAGDVVRLKSGGPRMTVTEVGENYGTLTAWCTWFSSKQETGYFPTAALELATDPVNTVSEGVSILDCRC